MMVPGGLAPWFTLGNKAVPISHEYALLDPHSIQLDRPTRQRSVINTGDLLDSIQRHGVLQPIIIRRDLILIAGERRLECCRKLGLQVPVRYIDELDTVELHIVELEENLKRSDLHWRDAVKAVGTIHQLYKNRDPIWTQEKTGNSIGLEQSTITRYLRVYNELDNPRIKDATGLDAAYNTLSKLSERVMANALSDVMEAASDVWSDVEQKTSPVPAEPIPEKPKIIPADESILQKDFLQWAPKYHGAKFNLIHCDFPYGINAFAGKQMKQSQTEEDIYDDTPEVYWRLMDSLCTNLDKLMSWSGHMIFWFSMKHYEKTFDFFKQNAPSLWVNPTPLVWYKSDSSGVAPAPRKMMRQVYETAFLCIRGDRPLIRVVNNVYAGPTNKEIHPSAKPEPMLYHFFNAMVDETTSLLDPTCGGATALKAAERLGAQKVLGLEIDNEHVKNAQASLRSFRVLRSMK